MNIAVLALAFMVVLAGVRTSEKASNVAAVSALITYWGLVVGLAAISAWLTALEHGWIR